VNSIKYTSLFIIVFFSFKINAQKVFSNLDSLVAYSANKSTTIKSGYLKLDQAKKAKLVAIYGAFDITGNGSFNITNNTKLPVSLFPSETFGGQPGTYQEIQTGIKYNSTANLYGDIKLLNIAGWQNLKLSKINLQSIEIENQLSRKNLHENIATTYFNIVNLNEQYQTTLENTKVADTLLQILTNKYAQGLVKQQDVNAAKVNFLNSQESANQINFLIQQQYIALKIICDIPESEAIKINQSVKAEDVKLNYSVEQNKLKLTSSLLKERVASNYYKQLKYANLPTISAFASNSNQQFSKTFKTFNSDTRWINSNYIGIKAVLILPTANSITQLSKAKYDYLLAKENSIHTANETNLEYSKLSIDYSKSVSQYTTNKEVVALQKDSYTKNLQLYKQGLIGLDQLMNSFNAMITSAYNFNSAEVNVLLSQSKIDINNKLK
jgi:outer membrane protein TolC